MERYKHLTKGGDYKITLNQVESMAALKAYDYGIKNLSNKEMMLIEQIMNKLKPEIWP